MEENKELEISDKLNKIYNNGDMNLYKEEISKILEKRYRIGLKFEIISMLMKDLLIFKNYILDRHKDTIDDKNKKIIAISHKLFISIASSSCDFESDSIKKVSSGCLSLNNCEIAPFLF